MSSTQPTYYATPPVLDFGSIAVGDTQTKSLRVEYRLAPSGSAGEVLLSQTTQTNEIFLVDDRGSNAQDLITISQNGTDFFNRLTISSFPATEPPNFITLSVRVAPTRASTNPQQDYVAYLRSIRNKPFEVPIHFRIVGGRYVTVDEVRRHMGPLGRQRTQLMAIHDSFGDTSFPMWTNSSGTWGQSRPNTRLGQSGPATHALSDTVFSDFGDYEAKVTLELTSSGTAGLVFGRSSASGTYFRATTSSVTGNAVIDKIEGSTTTTLSTLSVGTVANREVALRVIKHPTSAEFWLNEVLVGKISGQNISGYSGLTVTSAGTTTVDFSEYHVTQDVYQFPDSDIIDHILEEETWVQLRTGKVWPAQTITELLDYNDQTVVKMPFVLSRTFNTLPSFDSRTSTVPINEKAIYLSKRPIVGVVALEENMAAEGGADEWELRQQGRDGDYIVYPDMGKIVFMDNFPRNGRQSLKVIYTVGTFEVPPYIKRYVGLKAAIAVLSTLSGEAVDSVIEKLEKRLTEVEEFVPQKTLIYALGSGQTLR